MNIFTDSFKYCTKYIKSIAESKVLLIIDGHFTLQSTTCIHYFVHNSQTPATEQNFYGTTENLLE